jgi:hypothetical protein
VIVIHQTQAWTKTEVKTVEMLKMNKILVWLNDQTNIAFVKEKTTETDPGIES